MSGVLFFTLFVLSMTLPVPYVVLSPGPTYNTLGGYSVSEGKSVPIIAVKGHATHRTTGNLNLTTVSYSTSKLTAYTALRAWLDSTEQVVPRSAIFPPGESTNQVNQQNSAQFSQSQDSAVEAAFCQLGYPKELGVITVLGGGAAQGKLRPSDVIKTLDGAPVATVTDLTTALSKLHPGTSIKLGIVRAGTSKTVPITLGPPPEGRSGGSIGIEAGPICAAPFTVDLGLADRIGGPSAGMMFALGIIDKVGGVDLTHGRFIAGTGTIDAQGTVGPIGGIQLKMIAARNAGASLFLAPANNCNDVVGAIPEGLRVVKVGTLGQAVHVLEATADGKPAPHC